MVAIAREWREKKLSARLIMSVHDELVIECPSSEAEIVRDMMKSVMESRVNWDIPMTVEIGIGKNWREAKK